MVKPFISSTVSTWPQINLWHFLWQISWYTYWYWSALINITLLHLPGLFFHKPKFVRLIEPLLQLSWIYTCTTILSNQDITDRASSRSNYATLFISNKLIKVFRQHDSKTCALRVNEWLLLLPVLCFQDINNWLENWSVKVCSVLLLDRKICVHEEDWGAR